MDQPSLERNLLYRILAIQVELINTDKFVSAIVPPTGAVRQSARNRQAGERISRSV
jgi:hypothetical protein